MNWLTITLTTIGIGGIAALAVSLQQLQRDIKVRAQIRMSRSVGSYRVER